MVDISRLVQTWAPAIRRTASGHLIGERIVLTAWHATGTVEHPKGDRLQIRLFDEQGRTAWMDAKRVWPIAPPDIAAQPGLDVTLLEITDPAWTPPAGLSPVRFGRLTTDDPLPCRAVGFPRSEVRPDGLRGTKEIAGDSEPLTARGKGLIVFKPTTSTPARKSGWTGCSGAALYYKDLIIGVLVDDRRKDYPDGTQLRAVNLARCADLITALHDAGIPVHFEAAAPPGGAPADNHLPPGTHNLPDLPSTVFVGRDQALTALAETVKGGPTAITQSITGLGGIGKTTLALHYAHAHTHEHTLTWWLDASSAPALEQGLARLAEHVIPEPRRDWSTEHAAAQTATTWLQTHPGWLLILDNADRPATVTTLLGKLRDHGSILITSRYADFPTTTPLPLDTLTRPASLQLLADRSTRPTIPPPATGEQADAADAIADLLGDLPLALEHAAAYLRTRKTGYPAYLKLLAANPAGILAKAPSGDPHAAVTRTWAVTLRIIAETNPLAVLVLNIAAWYAPDNIPRTLLAPLAGEQPTALDDALALLDTYSMINLDEHAFSVHRLVQTVLCHEQTAPGTPRQAADTEEFPATPRALAHALLIRALETHNATPPPALWQVWRDLQPHIRAIQDGTGPTTPPSIASTVNQAATLLYHHGQLTTAIALLESTLAECERVLGPEHPDTLIFRNNLAGAYRAAGDLSRAIPLYEAAVAERERVLGPEHPDTLSFRNNLAGAYQVAGDLSRAIPLLNATLAERERVLGPDHPDTLTSRNDLACAYQVAGDLSRATPLFESTLAERERVLGPDHPDTLHSRNNLAGAYQVAGDLSRATPLLNATLAERERVLGPDHPDTMISRNNLAVAYQVAGDLSRATPLFESTLAERERVLGPDHPDTMISRDNLAHAHRTAGDLGRAIPLYQSTMVERERVLGPEHPNTLQSRNNLAVAYQTAGDLDRAIPLFEASMTEYERILGPDHPDTLTARNNLAVAYQTAGDLDRAIPLFEATMADSEQILGPDHPNTLTARNSLAGVYRTAGHLDRAISVYQATLAEYERVLGPDHPNTLTARNNLAVAYQTAGDLDRAIPLFEATMAASERILSPDHPNTLTARNNLAAAYKTAGDLDRAIPLFEATMADSERILGPDHPTTRRVRANLTRARDNRPHIHE